MHGMEQLITDIKAYIKKAGIKPSTFGTYAAGDGKLLSRLEKRGPAGRAGQCLPSTEQKIRGFMTENPPETLRKRAKGRGQK